MSRTHRKTSEFCNFIRTNWNCKWNERKRNKVAAKPHKHNNRSNKINSSLQLSVHDFHIFAYDLLLPLPLNISESRYLRFFCSICDESLFHSIYLQWDRFAYTIFLLCNAICRNRQFQLNESVQMCAPEMYRSALKTIVLILWNGLRFYRPIAKSGKYIF